MKKLVTLMLMGSNDKLLVGIGMEVKPSVTLDNDDFLFIGDLVTKYVDVVYYGLIDQIEVGE